MQNGGVQLFKDFVLSKKRKTFLDSPPLETWKKGDIDAGEKGGFSKRGQLNGAHQMRGKAALLH